jgi:hypothetical protein
MPMVIALSFFVLFVASIGVAKFYETQIKEHIRRFNFPNTSQTPIKRTSIEAKNR